LQRHKRDESAVLKHCSSLLSYCETCQTLSTANAADDLFLYSQKNKAKAFDALGMYISGLTEY